MKFAPALSTISSYWKKIVWLWSVALVLTLSSCWNEKNEIPTTNEIKKKEVKNKIIYTDGTEKNISDADTYVLDSKYWDFVVDKEKVSVWEMMNWKVNWKGTVEITYKNSLKIKETLNNLSTLILLDSDWNEVALHSSALNKWSFALAEFEGEKYLLDGRWLYILWPIETIAQSSIPWFIEYTQNWKIWLWKIDEWSQNTFFQPVISPEQWYDEISYEWESEDSNATIVALKKDWSEWRWELYNSNFKETIPCKYKLIDGDVRTLHDWSYDYETEKWIKKVKEFLWLNWWLILKNWFISTVYGYEAEYIEEVQKRIAHWEYRIAIGNQRAYNNDSMNYKKWKSWSIDAFTRVSEWEMDYFAVLLNNTWYIIDQNESWEFFIEDSKRMYPNNLPTSLNKENCYKYWIIARGITFSKEDLLLESKRNALRYAWFDYESHNKNTFTYNYTVRWAKWTRVQNGAEVKYVLNKKITKKISRDTQLSALDVSFVRDNWAPITDWMPMPKWTIVKTLITYK